MKNLICVFFLALSSVALAESYVCYVDGIRNVHYTGPVVTLYRGEGETEFEAYRQAMDECRIGFNDRCEYRSCFKKK